MGINSLLTSLALTLLLLPATDAQERSRSSMHAGGQVSASYNTGSHQQIRSGSYQGRGHRGYEKRAYRAPARIWVNGCNEWVSERFWVEESYDRVWVAPVYGWGFDSCGLRIRICIQEGYWNRVCRPGHYETRRVQRWVPGHWRPY